MSKQSTLRYFLTLLLVALSCTGTQSAPLTTQAVKPRFENRNLRRLSEMMPTVALPVSDSILRCPVLPDNKSLIVRYNFQHEVDHLGISLFSKETKLMLDESICDFLERLFLELVLQESPADVKRKLIEYHIHLKYDGENFGAPHFTSIYDALQNLTMPVSFKLRFEDKRGLATWNITNHHSLSLVFPLRAELINGMDKKEADDQLYNRLVQLTTQQHAYEDEQVEAAQLETLGQYLWRHPGNHFLLPALNSDTYYTQKNHVFTPLNTDTLPAQTLKTLFHTYTNGEQVRLLLTHRKYGHFTPQIEIPLNNFLSMFQRHYDLFTSAKQRSHGRLEVIAVIHHKNLNFIHLMRVTTTVADLQQRPLVMKADFYSNIPQQNIKSLFNIK